MREFITYTDAAGNDLIEAFVDGLPVKEGQKITRLLRALTTVERLGQPYFKAFRGYSFAFGELMLGDYCVFVRRLDGQPGEEK